MQHRRGTRARIANGGSFRAVNPRRVGLLLRVVAICVLIATFFARDPIAYLCIAIPVLMPPFLWVNSGAFGIPALPVISALYYLYYAMPLLYGNTLTIYKTDELVFAGLSVGLFLLAASAAAWPFLGPVRQAEPSASAGAPRYALALRARSFSNLASNEEMFRLIFVGLGAGIFFYGLTVSGRAGFLGSYVGVVRAVALPLASVACYLTGFARGSGLLKGGRWIAALAGVIALVILSISNLLLVAGAVNLAGAVLGYALSAKRIPWVSIGFVLALVIVFNAGKYSTRDEYWAPDSQSVQNASILRLPAMMANWFTAGLDTFVSGEPAIRKEPSLLERTSLLHMVLTVQEATPKFIPYLRGETYVMLPAMLVPRFLQPRKLASQAALNLMSVRYGRESEEATSKTTIGWGLVAEAYANFGNLGVIAAGVAFGVLCGILMRLSTTAAAASLAMLVTISSALTLCNVELDFSSLVLTLLQTIAGILAFAALSRFVRRRSRQAVSYALKKLD